MAHANLPGKPAITTSNSQDVEDFDGNRKVAQIESVASAYGHMLLDPLPDEDEEFALLAVEENWRVRTYEN